jgi:hypothetical protein
LMLVCPKMRLNRCFHFLSHMQVQALKNLDLSTF